MEIKLTKFAVDTKFTRLAVETKLTKLAVETKLVSEALLIYPTVPRPTTVDVN
jgi:hypothetical protein